MKKTEDELLKLHSAVESSGEAIFITDLQGIITYVNPAFTNLYGYSSEEVIGKVTPRILKSGVLTQESYEYFWKVILNKEVVRGELINKTKDGRLITVEGSANPILSDAGEIIGFIGVQHDITERKEADLKLKLSEEKFRKAFITSPDSVTINRMSDGLYVSINKGFTDILGYSEDEVIGKTSVELNIWANPEQRVLLAKEIQENGKAENFESVFKHKSGVFVYGLMSASIIELDSVQHILAITRDITSRKTIETELAKEQFLVNALMTNLSDHVYFKDRDSRFIRINKSHAESFGLSDPALVIGKSDFDFFTAEHAQQAFDDEHEIIRTGNPVFKEEKLTRIGRPDSWSSTLKMPLKDSYGEIVGTFGISRDISEQKKAEEQLLLLANALKGIKECVSITDMFDNVLFLNKSFYDTYGFAESDLKDGSIKAIRSLNNPPDLVVEILPATLRGGWEGELLNCRKDKSEFLVHLSTAVVKDDFGKPMALIGVASDITERKKTEESLRQSEERFRSVAKSANDAIITTNSKGIIMGWNLGAERAFQYSEKELLGQRLDIIIPSEFLELHKAGLKRIESSGEKHVIGKTVELHGIRKDGISFPIELSLSEWETSDGKFFTAIIRDITQRKRTELENNVLFKITKGISSTSNLDELLKLIHNSLGEVVYAENCFVALHDSKSGLFGFPYFIDKVDTTPSPTSMGKSCTAYVFRTIRPLLLTSDVFDLLIEKNEVELVGSPSPSWIGIPLQTPSKVIGVLVLQHYEKENVYSDSDLRFLMSIGGQIALAIERKQAEIALTESEKNLFESQKIAGLGSYNLDLAARIWSSSAILDSIFGIDEKFERSISGWIDLIHPEWKEQLSTYLENIIKGGNGNFDMEYKIIRKNDGKERWLHGRGELTFDGENKPKNLIGSITDITYRKVAEEEIRLKNELLQAINAEKDKFFSIIAHDLRGPMSAFVEVTKILADDIQAMSLEEIREIITSMRDDSANIYSLLENLLEWSRLKRGVMEFNPVKLQLSALVPGSVNIISASANAKRIQIVTNVPENIFVTADKHMIDTVIRNLLSNAVKFTRPGGKVSLSALNAPGSMVEICIADSGIGMSDDLKAKLFQINEKTSRPGTEGEASSGLGLLLCKEFVEKNGGKIRVESKENIGSIFSFILKE
jgi:PAS domain S-box-containing protein